MKEAIQAEFKRTYFDLGIYRFLNRHRAFVEVFLWASWIIGILGAAFHEVCGWLPTIVAGSGFILVAFAGAVDHIIIGCSLRRILRRLQAQGHTISLQSLLHYCKDILPR